MSKSKIDKELIKLQYGSMKEYNRIKKENKTSSIEALERDLRIKEANTLSSYMERLKRQETLKQQYINRKNLLLKYIGNNNYNLYLLAWDISYSNYYQIEDNIKRGKITIEEYNKIANDFLINNCIDSIVKILN